MNRKNEERKDGAMGWLHNLKYPHHCHTGSKEWESTYLQSNNRSRIVHAMQDLESEGWEVFSPLKDLSVNPKRHRWKTIMVRKKPN